MNGTKINKKTLKICVTGMMGALVFVSTFINIQIPMPGTQTMLHLGDISCILSAFILGPLYGGLASGIGSFLYDLTNPIYVDHSIFTLIFKFMLAFVCGLIAYRKGNNGLNYKLNIVAGVSGMLTYMILHLSETFIHKILLGVSLEAILLLVGEKALVSLANFVVAIIVAVPLGTFINKRLSKQKYWNDEK